MYRSLTVAETTAFFRNRGIAIDLIGTTTAEEANQSVTTATEQFKLGELGQLCYYHNYMHVTVRYYKGPVSAYIGTVGNAPAWETGRILAELQEIGVELRDDERMEAECYRVMLSNQVEVRSLHLSQRQLQLAQIYGLTREQARMLLLAFSEV